MPSMPIRSKLPSFSARPETRTGLENEQLVHSVPMSEFLRPSKGLMACPLPTAHLAANLLQKADSSTFVLACPYVRDDAMHAHTL